MIALVSIETIVIAILTVLVAGLLRSHAEILKRLHDLGAGLDPDAPVAAAIVADPSMRPRPVHSKPGPLGAAVDIAGENLSGEAVAVGVAGAEHRTMLAFLSSGCSTCAELWKALSQTIDSGQGGLVGVPGRPRIVIVTRDPSEESTFALRSLAAPGLTVVMSSRAWADYGVPGSPYFVFVDGPRSAIVGEGTASSWHRLGDLVRQSFADAGEAGEGERRGSLNGPEREARVDAELARAGIYPGDPRLYAGAPGQVFPGE